MKDDDVRALVKYRLEQAQRALADARFLLEGGQSTQGVINRSYYAMFYAVMALMQKSGQVSAKHAGLLSLFDKEFVKPGLLSRELSHHLHNIFELRQISDYKVMEDIPRDKAVTVLEKATAFVAALHTLISA